MFSGKFWKTISTLSWTRRIIAVIIIGLYVYVQYFILNNTIQEGMREIAMRSLGTLDALLGLIIGFYFASSSGSDKKTELLVEQARKKGDKVP